MGNKYFTDFKHDPEYSEEVHGSPDQSFGNLTTLKCQIDQVQGMRSRDKGSSLWPD
jgi:hypothetical protein